jgi:hypothetical protein
MKKLLFAALAVAGMTAAAKYVDPNPYGAYGPAMKPVPGRPMAIEWHLTDRAAIDKATAPEALEEILDDDDRIEALLAKVKPDYGTDAMDAARIAAISQYVMENADVSWWEFWRDDRSDEREDWAKALMKAACGAKDDYVAVYFLDQLRWCGMGCQKPCLRKLADKSTSKAVKDMAEMVADQIGETELD